jgi:acyl carrier protein
VVEQTVGKFGRLDGVIYAAGTSAEPAFRVIQEIGREECEWHFRPKVHGLYALERALEGRPLDFCLLFSSLSSILGGISFVGYTAANVFLDAFTQSHNRRSPQTWLSVNWDSWQTVEGRHDIIGRTVARFEMTPEEGAEALERILARGPATQVINSTGNFQARITQWVRRGPHGYTPGANEAGDSARLGARPKLLTPFVTPGDDLEWKIAGIWQHVLGIKDIGVHDNFFDLGGTSLTGLQIISRIQRETNVPVTPADFMKTPTVKAVAAILASRKGSNGGTPQT